MIFVQVASTFPAQIMFSCDLTASNKNPSDPMSLIWDMNLRFVWSRVVPCWTTAKRKTDQTWWMVQEQMRALRVRRQKMWEEKKGRENFTRRRCWWSKTEKWDRYGWETERDREKWTQEREVNRETSTWETDRKERTKGRSVFNHPFTDYKPPNPTQTLRHLIINFRDYAII